MSDRYERGRLLYENKRYAMAEKEIRQALAEEPDDGDSHRLLALCLLYQNKQAAALESAKEAVSLEPRDPQNHYIVSLILGDMKQYRDAERAIDEAKKLFPIYAPYHSNDAYLALNQGLSDEALMKADHTLSLDPTDDRALRIKAWALLQKKDLKAATLVAEEALRVAPESATSHAAMGWMMMKQKKLGPAITHFRESLRIDPTEDWAREGYLEAMRSRNPLYGWIIVTYWWCEHPPIVPFIGHPLVLVAILGGQLVAALVGLLMKQIGPHLLTMFMRFDPVAKESLDHHEIRSANILAVWIGVSFLVVALTLRFWTLPFFLPTFAFLYGMPFLFTRLFELRGNLETGPKYKQYCIGATAIGLVAIATSFFGPDNLTTPNLPTNTQDVSGILVSIFLVMTLFSRAVLARQLTPPVES